MTLTRELTNLSFPDIGAAFGGRHHTTIMHACDEIESLRFKRPTYRARFRILNSSIAGLKMINCGTVVNKNRLNKKKLILKN